MSMQGVPGNSASATTGAGPGTTVSFNFTPPPAVNLRCAAGGHRVPPDAELLEYMDGVGVAHCSECDERIEFARIPGGVLVPWAKSVVHRMATEGPTTEVLAEFNRMLAEAQTVMAAMTEFMDSVQLAKSLMNARPGGSQPHA